MKYFLIPLICFALIFAVNGCRTGQDVSPENVSPAIVKRTFAKPGKDGFLPDEAWNGALSFQLTELPQNYANRRNMKKTPFQPGTVRFLCDPETIYVRYELTDDDVFHRRKKNQILVYRYGDAVELFLKPEKTSCYWEFHGAPNGVRTTYFYPSPGMRELMDNFDEDEKRLIPGFKTFVRVNGTLNQQTDKDSSWILEMHIPFSSFRKQGIKLVPGETWRFKACRYNYSIYSDNVQLSAMPNYRNESYHATSMYFPIVFEIASKSYGL